jgi:hypothetical protein
MPSLFGGGLIFATGRGDVPMRKSFAWRDSISLSADIQKKGRNSAARDG